jgi:hypothetical protein
MGISISVQLVMKLHVLFSVYALGYSIDERGIDAIDL